MYGETTAARIYLEKRSKVLLEEEPSSDGCPPAVVGAFSKNLESVGSILSRALFEKLLSLPIKSVERLHAQIIPLLEQMIGDHRYHSPMYPNFPAQVMEASDLELYLNAMAHYWGSFVADVTGNPEFVILPDYPKDVRFPLDEPIPVRVVDLGSKADFESIFTSLIGANGSLSEGDKQIVRWFAENRSDDIRRLVPPSVPQKENLAFLTGCLLKKSEPDFLLSQLKTATDVLRVAVVLSFGDVSLALKPRFRKFSRRERKFLLKALEGCGGIIEDMLRHKGYWIRLGEILHPSEYKNRFPKVHEAFDVLRNNKPFATFESKLEAAFREKKLDKVVELSSRRPGVFARRLDHILGVGGGLKEIDAFLKVAEQASTPVLLQAFHHFKGRGVMQGSRTFFPKGRVAKVQVLETPLEPLPGPIVKAVVEGVRSVLVERFAKLPPLGKVRVDEALKDHMVPFGMRSASKSLRTIARGSRLDLPEGNTIRFFLWWKNGEGRTDIDLSAVIYDEEWIKQGDISYFSLRNPGLGWTHSGDIVDAPKGACEFIDIDLSIFVAAKLRYVTMCLNSFTMQPYCDLPECFAGWMARKRPQSGEIFEGRTVRDKVDIASNTKISIPVILDLKARRVIWADLALKTTGPINNILKNSKNIARMSKAIVQLDRPNLYDLFLMHAEARGRLVSDETADTIFSIDEGITPFDGDRILSEFLV